MSSFWDKWAQLLKDNQISREELTALFAVLHNYDHIWAEAGREPPIESMFLKQYPNWLVRSDPEMRIRLGGKKPQKSGGES